MWPLGGTYSQPIPGWQGIDDQDYKYVLKPYGKTRENFPSKLRNYPIIKPIVDLLLGEKSKRPLNYSVVVKNADSVSLKEEAKKKGIEGISSMKKADLIAALSK